MKNKISRLVRLGHEHKTTTELLGESVTTLLGVSSSAADVLSEVGIRTIFDLASSRLLDGAAVVADARDLSSSPPYGRVPSGIAGDGAPALSATALAAQPLSALHGLDQELADSLEQALDVSSVRELAYWPPYLAARAILSDAYGATGCVTDDDDGVPPELVPVAGQYAVESFKYSKVFIDQLEGIGTDDFRELSSGTQLEIISLDVVAGFRGPATGAYLTFVQEWVPQGLSLGQLLSSVALAPGESTKIAVIDWTRRVTTAAKESIDEAEALDASMQQTRAISEIQRGVASEVNRGESTQSTSSNTKAGGVSGGLGFFSGNFSQSNVSGSAVSVASSAGERNVSAEMTQNISDFTKQQSSAVRSRRASVVTETEQSESETLRTRILTNYNHSHALSVHYYEVVQIFRTRVRLRDHRRVLFVPMKQLDFKDWRVIERFKQVLVSSVSSRFVRDQIVGFTSQVVLDEMNGSPNKVYEFDEELEITHFVAKTVSGAPRATAIRFAMKDGRKIERVLRQGLQQLEQPLPLMDVEQIEIVHATYTGDLIGSLRTVFILKRPGVTMPAGHLEFVTSLRPSSEATPCARTRVAELDKSVGEFLNGQALFFSQRIWASLNQQQLAMLLSRYSFRGEPIVEVVDLDPLTVFGNYLVLPYYPRGEADDRWKEWQERHVSPQRVVEDFVPVPTNGLFAEAVLGRSNASEKLDITRFWDWQDSPIPMQAPDIGPLQAGRHAAAVAPLPGQLGVPIVSIQTPQALPAPVGLGPMFATLQNDLFRDLSGLEQTAANLRASVDASSSAAENAAKLATELEAIRVQTMAKMAEMALAAATGGMSAAATGGMGAVTGIAGGIRDGMAGGPLAGASNSRVGAALNYGLKRAEEGIDGRSPQVGTSSAAGAILGSRVGSTGRPSFETAEMDAYTSWVGESTMSADARQRSLLGTSLNGAVAGAGGLPIDGGFPIAAQHPLNADTILNHSFFKLPERSTLDEFFPSGELVGNRIDEQERQRAIIRGFWFTASSLDQVSPDAEVMRPIPLLTYLIFDFPVGESNITADDLQPLRNLLERRAKAFRDRNLHLQIDILGTTDDTGSEEVNRALRLQRAQRVAELLGSTSYQIRHIGHSDSAIAPETNELGRALNRSVTVHESARQLGGASIPRKPNDIEVIKSRTGERLRELRENGKQDANISLCVWELYNQPTSDLSYLTKHRVQNYYNEYTPNLARRINNPFYRADRFFIDGRAEIHSVLNVAPNAALATVDTEEATNLAADDVINAIMLLARSIYEGINRHAQFSGIERGESSVDPWDMMSREIHKRVNNPNSIYGKCYDKYEHLLDIRPNINF